MKIKYLSLVILTSIISTPLYTSASTLNVESGLVETGNEVYAQLIGEISPNDVIGSSTVKFHLDPFNNAPLSMSMGVYLNSLEEINITVSNEAEGALPFTYTYIPKALGAQIISLTGFYPNSTTNTLSVNVASIGTVDYSHLLPVTASLPLGDDELSDGSLTPGFVYQTLETPKVDLKNNDDLYLAAPEHRYVTGYDENGDVRFYISNEILTDTTIDPSATPDATLSRLSQKLNDGNFMGISKDYKSLYVYDQLGRIVKEFNLENRVHHSLSQMSNDTLVITSEKTQDTDPNVYSTREDVAMLVDYETGEVIDSYDMSMILDPISQENGPQTRPPQPNGQEDPNNYDWFHLNEAYMDETRNLLVASGRMQNMVLGVDKETKEISFIAGSEFGIPNELQGYLLTPIDQSGNPYPNETEQEKGFLDNNFWNWGQHSVVPVESGDANILQFMIFDNGNYASYDENYMKTSSENSSAAVQYRVNLTDMTIQKVGEWGKELGLYASYVGTVQPLENGNLFINFGGTTYDSDGCPTGIAGDPDNPYDVSRIVKLRGESTFVEVNPNDNELIFKMKVESSNDYYGFGYNPVNREDSSDIDFCNSERNPILIESDGGSTEANMIYDMHTYQVRKYSMFD